MWKVYIRSASALLLLTVVRAGVIRDFQPINQAQVSGTVTPLLLGDHNPTIPSLLDHHAPVKHEAKHEHKHKVKHEHATSHQTFKIHHFHAVPVYVKKEHLHLLKHPVELGGVKHKLKQIHPESHKNHGYGYVLENHTDSKHKHHHHHDSPPAISADSAAAVSPPLGVKHASEQLGHLRDFFGGANAPGSHRDDADDGPPHQFHDINVRSGVPQYH